MDHSSKGVPKDCRLSTHTHVCCVNYKRIDRIKTLKIWRWKKESFESNKLETWHFPGGCWGQDPGSGGSGPRSKDQSGDLKRSAEECSRFLAGLQSGADRATFYDQVSISITPQRRNERNQTSVLATIGPPLSPRGLVLGISGIFPYPAAALLFLHFRNLESIKRIFLESTPLKIV